MKIRVQQNGNGVSVFNQNEKCNTNKIGGIGEGIRTFKQEAGKSIFAGNLTLTTDGIEQKREMARKKAMRVLEEEFGKEKEIDAMVDEQKEIVAKLKEDMKDSLQALKDTRVAKERYMAEYGLDKEGAKPTPEQTLELIEFAKAEGELTKDMILAKEEAKARNMAVEDIMVERLKSHGMVDAQKEADDIMEAASKEILNEIVDEAKDQVDEKLEEEKEKAEELKEKKEEEQEKLEEKKETPEQTALSETVETMGEIQDISQDCQRLQRELKVMVEMKEITAEDIKGILVNQKL